MTDLMGDALAITLLAKGISKAEVARRVGVSPSTIYRWLGNPEFRARLDEMTAKAEEAAQAEIEEVYQEGTAMALEMIRLSRQAGRDLIAIGPKGRMAQVVARNKLVDTGMKAWMKMVDIRHPSSGRGSVSLTAMDEAQPRILPQPQWGTEGCPLPPAGRTRVGDTFMRWMKDRRQEAREAMEALEAEGAESSTREEETT